MHSGRNRPRRQTGALAIALISLCWGSAASVRAQDETQSQQPFRGGLNPVRDAGRPHPVRNDVAQPGDEIVTLRYFKIKKGSFDEFLRVSVEGVWPYFEKLGSRVIGMWKVVTPAGVAGAPQAENKDYDEVYLSSDASHLGGSMKRFLADYQSRSGAGHLESASRQ